MVVNTLLGFILRSYVAPVGIVYFFAIPFPSKKLLNCTVLLFFIISYKCVTLLNKLAYQLMVEEF